MAHYSRLIAECISSSTAWCELIFNASPMHDIGKIGVPDHILRKPGPLTNDEWEVMKQHPTFGYEILDGSESDLLSCARDIAYCHHEKWDGSGYPRGLKGEDIPLSARIVALADVYDALTSTRPYKTAWNHEDACELLISEAHHHFDPRVVSAFIDKSNDILKISNNMRDIK